MSAGAFLRREWITSVRRGSVFSERCTAAGMTSAAVAVCLIFWDWKGRDWTSVVGASAFALDAFAWSMVTHLLLALGEIPSLVAPGIASERDRKSLDSLLASRLRSGEIVLGTMGAGLLRYANGWAALAPLITLMVYLGGADPRLVLVTLAGMGSTALLLASISVAVSAVARSAARASSWSVLLGMSVMLAPGLIVILLPRIWPAVARWVVPVALPLLDGSPIGVGLSLTRVIPRGAYVPGVVRMIVVQLLASAMLVGWAIVRLRPASRAVYDAESRAGLLRILRARWWPRPACGDDPVLWHEMYPGRRESVIAVWVGRVMNIMGIGLLAYGVSWFAIPAFAELFQRGYGAGPSSLPTMNPFIRVLVDQFLPGASGPSPGNVRLELNIVLRQLTALLDVLFLMMVAGASSEGLAREREQDTWIGLISTPLSGLEIVRGKMLGALWKSRGLGLILIALWCVGLATGAVHPLGFLASMTILGVSSGLLAALGVLASLRSQTRAQATQRVLVPLMFWLTLGALPFVLPGMLSALLGTLTSPFQIWLSLLSYEDMSDLLHGRAPAPFLPMNLLGPGAAYVVLAGALVSTIAQAVVAFLQLKWTIRDFDAVVGRPIRSGGGS